jgi:small-conductance mechanosensitive channel
LLTEWYDRARELLPNLIVIAVILFLTIMAARRAQGFVYRLAERTQSPPEITDLLGRFARFGIVAFGALIVLDRLNLSGAVLSFVAGLGIAGIIIGFALQDIVKQFAAGMLLLMLRPFRVGDDVKIGEFEGRVVQVQLRATVLKTAGGDEVQIPNADVYSTAIVNTSRYDLRRHALGLALPPGAELGRTRAALLGALGGVPGVAGNPAPEIVATGIADKAAQLEVRFWVDERAGSADTVITGVVAALHAVLVQIDTEAKK